MNVWKKIGALLVSLCLILGAAPVENAGAQTILKAEASLYDQLQEGSVSGGYYIMKVSRAEAQQRGDYQALKRALLNAKEKATKELPVKVVVEPGTYVIEHGLNIYSNTYLYVHDVVIKQKAGIEANLIKCGDAEDTAQGYYHSNIVIDGGVWDENGNSNTAIKFAHAKNIKWTNMMVQNCKDSHLAEVAAIDGFTVDSCVFQDQVLDVNTTSSNAAGTKTYEAIQLDILVKGHFNGYKAEALQMKNVSITGCTFKDLPRGVGSHTSILNCPVENIEISNNTFTNMKSRAIQILNCVGCTIANNKITNTPQGIMVLSYSEQGLYLPSTLAEQGGVATQLSSDYQKPVANAKIVIKNNDIQIAGKDPYAKWEKSGIYVGGLELDKDLKSGAEVIPAGNYYLSGVKISGNTISGKMVGIRVKDAKKASIENNTIKNSADTKNKEYGIDVREKASVDSVKGNKVSRSLIGIHVVENASVNSMTGNKVTDSKKHGIFVEQNSTVKKISKNTINKTAVNGIFFLSNGSVSKAAVITGNTIKNSGKYGIGIENSKVKKVSGNKISSAKQRDVNILNK
ncbi:MAG: right-handed parallel beta-helix repeat-containing protein [Blautia sp.]|nr:right-handed parallel beta-helix repeat-containing protein [Blautia sp.]